MTALGGREVEATLSAVRGLAGGFLGSAALEPHGVDGVANDRDLHAHR
jgi:hypothetical protein